MWGRIRLPLALVTALLLAILLIIGYNYLKDPKHLPIKTVRVDGKLSYLQQDELQTLMAPYVSSSFFTLDVKAVQDVLTQHPWVSRTHVRRMWPDTILVEVKEHRPLAFWGDSQIISDEGVLFRPVNAVNVDLPKLDGPDEQEVVVWNMYATLNSLSAPHDVQVTQLGLNARRAWQAKLSNGMQLQLGSMDVVERFKRFVQSYPHDLSSNAAHVSYVDLRYTNGFVIAKEQPNG